MLDDLLDMFDRDRRNEAGRPQRRRGVRGMLDRLAGDHEDDDRARHDGQRDFDDDDAPRGSRRRNRDSFDLDD